MKLTIKQKQGIYEHLISLECDDLLAALIADRCDITIEHEPDQVHSWIGAGFWWETSPEGQEFWEIFHEDCAVHCDGVIFPVDDYFYDEPPVSIEYTAPVKYTTGDTVKSSNGEIFRSLEVSNSSIRTSDQPLSLFTKVKLFLGKLFYRV